MKTAIFIKDGMLQLVLTPENEWEKSVIKVVDSDTKKISILRGSFYECQGGWIREGRADESLIMRIDTVETDEQGREVIPPVVEQ